MIVDWLSCVKPPPDRCRRYLGYRRTSLRHENQQISHHLPHQPNAPNVFRDRRVKYLWEQHATAFQARATSKRIGLNREDLG